ncbi:DNA polymerase I [Thermospira aquatica]|uniref:DNA polymerase I n=1 Tax=Thermospira aquatica TaxID=2828656 RepID=A0AAX3BAQ0_9SPIR|nr:DNA polymerase I [Thermospira aquatica]URA09335.1 DNA polymerase I [Thermospira aquatica]
MQKPILLVDGSGLVYRSFFAFIRNPLINKKNQNVSAIYGTLRMILQAWKLHQPEGMIVAFDVSRQTFRTALYPEYKAQRQQVPPDLKSQIPGVIELLRALGITVIEEPNYEADDILATLVEKYQSSSLVYLVSSDKDLLQLVGPNTYALRPQKGIEGIHLVDREKVYEEIGVYPEQIPDYLAIVGDTSDNIPGVKGIGEKGAVELLRHYGTLEEIYEHLNELSPAMRTKLEASRKEAFLSKQLATVRRDVPFTTEVSLSHLRLTDEAEKLLLDYEIPSLLAELKGTGEKHASSAFLEGAYHAITEKIALSELLERIRREKRVSLDIETTSLDPYTARIATIAFALEEGGAFVIPAAYSMGQPWDENEVLESIRKILEDEGIGKIGQNLKFEYAMFFHRGIELKGIMFDTMMAAYLLSPTRTHFNLENLCREYLGYDKMHYEDMFEGKNQDILTVSREKLVHYAGSDVDAALRLFHVFSPEIEKMGLQRVFYEIELPLIPVLARMEYRGIGIDETHFQQLSRTFREQMDQLQVQIYHLAGHEFNIQSSQQLAKVLFEELKLPPVKKTEKGKLSTDEEVLNALSAIHPLPAAIVQYRTFAKLLSTYVEALPALMNPVTGRVHTHFNQTITATGRLSSSDPNLQNIPVRDQWGKAIREAFVPRKGWLLMSADYSQVELRILAHFSEDKAMVQAFQHGEDIHARTAMLIFGVESSAVTEEMRRRAKSVNFGIIYGLQAYGLSQQLGIPVSEARQFIEAYFASFPSVKEFIEKTLSEAYETGMVRTLSGRFRRFPELRGQKRNPKGGLDASERMAINTKIQGSAADLIKIAMIRVEERLQKEHLSAQMLLQIHDELVLEFPPQEQSQLVELVRQEMEEALALQVPLRVDIGIGKNWSEAKA